MSDTGAKGRYIELVMDLVQMITMYRRYIDWGAF